jgi:hypothetical protein
MQGGIDLTILSLLIEKKTKAASMSKSTRGPKKHQHSRDECDASLNCTRPPVISFKENTQSHQAWAPGGPSICSCWTGRSPSIPSGPTPEKPRR